MVAPTTARESHLASLSALAYVRAENARTRALAEADPEGWYFYLTEEPEAWAHCANGLEVAFHLTCQTFSDVYKESYNLRPRWKFASLAEVEAELAALYASLEEERAWKRAREEERAHQARQEAVVAPEKAWWDAAHHVGAEGW